VTARAQIHHRFGIQCRGVKIVRIPLCYFTHRVRKRSIKRFAIRVGVCTVSLRDCINIGALGVARLGRERNCFLNRLVGSPITFGINRQVVIRTEGKGDTPVRHGAVRVEAHGFLKCAIRLIVIKGID
jgi:hypothetical protein